MTSRYARNRRFRTADAVAFMSAQFETLERRRLLSAANEGAAETQLEASPLTQYRQRVFDLLVDQADARYGGQFGEEVDNRPDWYDWRVAGEDLSALQPASDLANLQLAASRAEADAFVQETNVQVVGVDEGDLVETDGENLFVLRDGELVILNAATERQSSEVISRIVLPGAFSGRSSMVLFEDRLTIVASAISDSPVRNELRIPSNTIQTTVVTYDISDASVPELIQETIVDGMSVGTRSIDGQLYVAVQNSDFVPYLPALRIENRNVLVSETDEAADAAVTTQTTVNDLARFPNGSGFFESREVYIDRLRDVVFGTDASSGIRPPAIYQRSTENLLHEIGWLDGAIDQISDSTAQLVSLLHFDTTSAAPGPVDNVGLQTARTSGTVIYATESAVYLASTEYQFIDIADRFLLSLQSEPSTAIHKISIGEAGLDVAASGRVPGVVDSQFSLDEHKGYLRVATTTGQAWNESSANHLFVLEDVERTLVEVGSIRDLAPTEQIYSMRYDGDRAWMVTFQRIDPVFSLDLSDPANPQVAGELKIPGYSDYLQLIDEGRLLAIGRGATEQGLFQEVQVSLLDVSDLASPELLHRYSFDGGRSGASEALYEHHAFQFYPDLGVLAIPFTDYQRPTNEQAGTVLLKIDQQAGISELGEVMSTGGHVYRNVRIGEMLHAVAAENLQVIDLSDTSLFTEVVSYDLASTAKILHEELQSKLQQRRSGLISMATSKLADADLLRIELNDLYDFERLSAEELNFEFRLLDPSTGTEFYRETSSEPALQVSEFSELLEGVNTIDVQFRTRSAHLQNAAWTEWSQAKSFSISNEFSRLISTRELTPADLVVKWSAVPDQLLPPDLEGELLQQRNSVSHYEFWLSDAVRRETIEWVRDLPTPEYDVSQLAPGSFWCWFRPVFEDGSVGAWSAREAFTVFGEQLATQFFESTASLVPVFNWENRTGATSFEAEIQDAQGAIVYSGSTLTESRFQPEQELQPGEYSIRVRAALPNGGYTKWTDAHSFFVAGRPEPVLDGDTIRWAENGALRSEVWVSRLGSTDALLHVSDVEGSELTGVLSSLGDGAYGQFSVWVKSWMKDGTHTAWSIRQTIQRFADAIKATAPSSFLAGNIPLLSWNPVVGIDSYEVYVQKKGEPGPVFRESTLSGSVVELATQLEKGDYLWWVRGALPGGGFTKWGPANTFQISDTPIVSVVDNVLSWASDPNAVAPKFEVWVNRVDENFGLLESRALHVLDAIGDRLELSSLIDGRYSAWVRQVDVIDGIVVKSAWSQRADFEVSTVEDLVDDVIDVFEENVDDLLDCLSVL